MRVGVPFNRPHRLFVRQVAENSIECSMPYAKRNFNHLNGMHACAIATLGEYCSGLSLLLYFKPELYRLIMKKIEVSYHYQGRSNLHSKCQVNPSDCENLLRQLSGVDTASQDMSTEIYDTDNNHIATVCTTWQVKPWSKVRLKKN